MIQCVRRVLEIFIEIMRFSLQSNSGACLDLTEFCYDFLLHWSPFNTASLKPCMIFMVVFDKFGKFGTHNIEGRQSLDLKNAKCGVIGNGDLFFDL